MVLVRSVFCRRLVILAAALLVVGAVSGVVVGGEDDDPYAADPLGLIAHYDLTTELGTTSDVFEVWMCYISGGGYGLSQVTAEQFVPVLANAVGGYWSYASGGKYEVSFVVGGNITDPAGGCRAGVRAGSGGGSRAALIIEFNSNYPAGGAGNGTAGRWCTDGRNTWWCEQGYPENGRDAVVQAGGGPQAVPPPSAVAHEMGHTLGFSHSYTGLLAETHFRREYDNPMDIMSGGGSTPYPVGMIAPNRYAAGWIDPDQVHVYQGGTSEMILQNRGGGVLMLVVPSGEQGMWLSVGARIQESFNAAPTDGVEVYVVDERSSACARHEVCWGTERLITPYPTDRADPLAHVLSPGDTVTWNNVTLSVTSRTGGGYQVNVTDGTVGSGTFLDDDGSVHEPDIEKIAQLGVTVGCATRPEPLFCPDRSVTRAEMAAFLMRYIQHEPGPVVQRFVDVPTDTWYASYVQGVADLGIDQGTNNQWFPHRPLTRLEMASWLTAAFGHITPVTNPVGLFSDVASEHWQVVEGLYQVGVTKGCSAEPLLYCPDQPVTRAEMASFLIRSLPPN